MYKSMGGELRRGVLPWWTSISNLCTEDGCTRSRAAAEGACVGGPCAGLRWFLLRQSPSSRLPCRRMPGSRSILRPRLLRLRPSHPSKSRSRRCPEQSRRCQRRPGPKCPKCLLLRPHRLRPSLIRHRRSPVEAPVEVAAPKPAQQLLERACKRGILAPAFARCIDDRVVRRSEPQHAAISPPRPVTHVQAPVTRRHVHKPARHAARASTSRWYQVPAAQYQRSADRVATSRSKSPPPRAQAGSVTDRHAPSGASPPIRGKPPNGASNCVRKAMECVDSCTDNADWKVVRNDRWISSCTSPNATGDSPHEGRDSNSDGQLERIASPSTGESGPQYQCPGSQYHHHWCDETETGTEPPDEEPPNTCPDTVAPVDAADDEDDPDSDAGDWETAVRVALRPTVRRTDSSRRQHSAAHGGNRARRRRCRSLQLRRCCLSRHKCRLRHLRRKSRSRKSRSHHLPSSRRPRRLRRISRRRAGQALLHLRSPDPHLLHLLRRQYPGTRAPRAPERNRSR